MVKQRPELGSIFLIGLVSLPFGCAAQQKQKIMGEPVHRPVAILVHISNEVNAADHAGGVAELVQTLQDGLKDEGIESDIYTADDDHPPPPRIELNVLYWQETNQTSRDLVLVGGLLGVVGAFTGPNNRMVVDCGVFLEPRERRVLWQRFDVGKGLNGAGEASAGRNAGQAILQRIFLRATPGGAGLTTRNAPPKAAPAFVAPSDHQ